MALKTFTKDTQLTDWAILRLTVTEDSIDTAKIIGLEAKDKLDIALKETKSNVNVLKENYRIFSEKAKGKASSELLKAQMNMPMMKTK